MTHHGSRPHSQRSHRRPHDGDPDRAQRDAALEAIARAIEQRADEIEAANRLDVAAATGTRPSAIIDRLTLTPERIAGLAEGVRAVIGAARPDRHRAQPGRARNGLVIEKVRVPLGVVAVIYEARPNVTTDAAALTIKSGNACILRGSRMAAHTNRVLIDLVRAAIEAAAFRSTPCRRWRPTASACASSSPSPGRRTS